MATLVLGLTQPEYLSDGETAVDAVNTNFSILDGIYTYLLTTRIDGSIMTSRTDGKLIVNRFVL